MNFQAPPLLKPGDHVGVVSPAKKVDREMLEAGIEVLRSWDLNVTVAPNAFSAHNSFAGDDSQRAGDLQRMLDSPEVRAIFCSRGGYGTTRIIDSLDLKSILQSPKWLIGFSDITAILMHLAKFEIQSLHALMPVLFAEPRYAKSVAKLRSFLFSGRLEMRATGPQIIPGSASAPIVGGNLSLLCNIIGTSSDLDLEGKILFLEEVDEYGYRVDRSMMQLKRSGKLQGVMAVILGHLTDIKETESMGKTVVEIIQEHLMHLSVPIGVGFPIGHEPDNYPVPIGRLANLTILEKEATLTFT